MLSKLFENVYRKQLSGDGPHVDHVVQDAGQKLAQIAVVVEMK